jgi:hypothetical protein
MAQQADIEKDPFLVLLTDALRAGPGSPEWRDAVSRIKAGEGVDEYRLLIDAREALESGKDYRSVRAGAGFTKKLLTTIEQEQPAAKRSIPLAAIIAVLAGIVILSVIGVVAYQLYPRGTVAAGNSKAIDELASTYLPTQVLSTTFDKEIPVEWRTIGLLPIQVRDGLRAGSATVPPNGYSGGGIVTLVPIPPDQTVSLQVTLNIKSPGEDLIPQVFVSNSPEFSPDRAISAQELVWELKGKEQHVVVNGQVKAPTPLPAHTQTMTVRIVLNHDLGVVESDGHRLWAGPNALGDQPRYLGIRFIRTDGKEVGDVSVQSARVQKS